VSDTGRVVVLDFGLVRETSQIDDALPGTPAYISPEQASGAQLTAAADWYAFGVMLYEAISGTLPFAGRTLQNKLRDDPQPLRGGAPTPVLDLCMALLSREPAWRPSGVDVLAVLAAASGQSREPTAPMEQPLTAAAASLFGRDAELARMHSAWVDVASHSSVVVHVRGASGSGKSTLVERFLDEARSDDSSAVVLRCGCYERESMPFKALDGVVDALVSHLSQVDDVTCAQLLPSNIADLARLFPVFGQLHSVQRLRGRHDVQGGDETQLRRRGELALRTLVTNIARERRLVLWIDDLQWGDLDSACVLRGWLEQPLEAPLMLVLSYRSEETETSSVLARLLDHPEPATQLTIALDPLQASDVRALCLQRLPKPAPNREEMIECIVQASDGNPFVAQQLAAVAEAKLTRNDGSLHGLSMAGLVQSVSAYLSEPARQLLNVLAVAGRPLHPQLALTVAGIVSAGRTHIHMLRELRLVRTRDVAGESMLEIYHDRVREVTCAALDQKDHQRIHAALFEQLSLHGRDDHDWMHQLALGAGQREHAFRHGWLAAERASESLAFERAATLYESCVSLCSGELPMHVLWMKLAAAQAHCRRGHEAARAYASAAEYAPPAQRTPLLQLAASQLVRSGRFEEGERVVQQVLDAEHLHVPKTAAGMIAALGWEHARVALHGFDVPERPASQPHPLEQRALLYGTLSIDTQLYAPLRAALFQASSLRLALEWGQPSTIARTLCLAAATAASAGTRPAARRAHELLQHAERLFEREACGASVTHPPLDLLSARAMCAQLLGGLEQALESASAGERAIAQSTDHHQLFALQR
ncbi:MAG TPA: AAA family ATPase, partial [Polyangiales bacterium]|nr:AAA family ATPase [Polyangiales bacterium]